MLVQKIALISDIHGNLTAFQAVLTDAKQEQVTEYWFLGDYLMPGPTTNQILEWIQSCHPSICLRGNWEGVLLESIDGLSPLETPTQLYLNDLSQYQAKHLFSHQIDWLRQLPIADNITVDDWHISLSHHLPKKSWGRELITTQDQAHFDALFTETKADIAIYGHIHQQLMRYSSNGRLIINPGSVGQPFHLHERFNKDLRAQYAILEIDKSGVREVSFKKVAYDIEKEIELAQKSQLPYRQLYIEELRTGKIFTYEEKRLVEVRKSWVKNGKK